MQSYSTFGINHTLSDILHDNLACTKLPALENALYYRLSSRRFATFNILLSASTMPLNAI